MQITTGGTLNGKAGTASVVTYTINGNRRTTTNSYETLGQGQLASSTGAMLATTPVAASTQLLISSILFTNTSASPVTGIVLYLNGTGASNQIVQLSLVANGSASYAKGKWETYDSGGNALGGSGVVDTTTNQTVGGVKTFSSAPILSVGETFTGNVAPTYAQGKLVYDTDNESLTFYNNDSNVSLQIGQEEWTRVKNVTGSTISNGQAVYINGADAGSGLPTIALAKGDAATTIIGLGLTTESIANNAIGVVTTMGVVHGLDTSGFSAGATVFVSATTAGALTSTAPTSPNYRYRIGIVAVSSATIGSIHVTPSTAALGNGTGNQVFGMNNAGTAQEVKTIQGTANDVVITNGTNTITASTGSNVYKVAGTDVAITDGGTGVSTLPSGILKGAGTGAITAAVASTDYIGATTGSAIQKASAGGLTAATAGTDYLAPAAIGTTVQAFDTDLTTIAGLTATTNNFLQAFGSAWASRTPTQATATLDLATNVLKGLQSASDKLKEDNMYYDVTANSISNLVGDDSTDNTSAWNTLFAGLPVGATLFWPAGTFRTSTGFNISSDKHLRNKGAGKYVTYIKTTGATGNGFHINGSFWFNTFEDMGFIHLLTGASVTGGAGININPGASGSAVGTNIYRCSFSGLFVGIRAVGSQAANLSIWDSVDITASQTTYLNAVPNARGILWNGDTINMVISNSTINMIFPAPAFSQVPASGSAGMEVQQSGAIQLIGGEFIGGTNTFLMNANQGGTTSVAAVYACNSFFDQSNASTVKITGANIVNRCKFVQCGITTGNTGATGAIAVEIASAGTGAAGGATAAADGIDFFLCDVYPNGVTGTTNGFQITGAQGIAIAGCRISGFTNGIAVTPAAANGYTKVFITNNKMGATNNFTTPNTVGLLLNAGSFNYGPIIVTGNDFTGSTTPLSDSSTVLAGLQKQINDNVGMLLSGLQATTTTSPAFVVAETLLVRMPIPANGLQIGDTVRATLMLAVSASNTPSIKLRYGTAGTTADTAVLTVAPTWAAAQQGHFTIFFTVRTLGSSGTAGAVGSNYSPGILDTAANQVLVAATPTINTTVANWLSITMSAGAITGTVHLASLEVL